MLHQRHIPRILPKLDKTLCFSVQSTTIHQNQMTEQEQLSVSDQVDTILEAYQDQFFRVLNKNKDDAIAIGDEVKEWLRDLDNEVILFYNERELKQQYKDLRKQNGRK